MDWISPRVCRDSGRPLGIVLALFVFPAIAAAQPPEPTQLRVARLIDDLKASDFDTRRRAFARLERIGPESREQLEAAARDSDPEVRLRATQLLEQLELEQLFAPSRVSARHAGQSASTLLLELARQTGNHIHIGDPYGTFADEKIDAQFDGVAYWEAVDDICARTGNRMRPHYDMHTPGVVISAGAPGEYPRAYAGPIRAQITSAKRHFVEELEYGERKSELTHSFHINLQFNWEDQFRIVGYATQPELVEGRTDNHVVISAAQHSGAAWNATSRGLRQVTASLKLNPIPVSATSLDVFSIRWGVIAIGQPAMIEITQLQADQEFAQDDVAARIESIETPTPGKVVLTLNVSRDLVMPEPHEVVFREYDVELFDQNGQPFRIQNQAPALTERGVQLRTTFHGEASTSEPKSLKLHYPRLRARRNVVLTFHDVPLPAGRPE
jgi:hypothetical protein